MKWPAATGQLTVDNIVPRLEAAQATVTSYDVAMSVTGRTPVEATGSVDLADGKHNVAIEGTSPHFGDVELRFVDGVLYVDVAALTGGKFVQLDAADLGTGLGKAFTGFTDRAVTGTHLDGMKDAITSVTATGAPETLDGVEVQAYDVVVDTARLTADAAAEARQAGVTRLPATLTSTFWVDGDDLIRKVTSAAAGTTTTVTITNIGAGSPVAAPPADQITTQKLF